ncbi:MAG: redoxin domain-containing protein [Agriterribacter sp.]
MKYLIILMSLSFITKQSIAQKDTTAVPSPAYTLYPLPQFSVLLPDSTTWYTQASLPKNKKTVVMVFSPDCEHCQHETELLKQNIAKFKRAQLLMVTPMPFDKMRTFYKKYELSNYKNITVGYDPKFFFNNYFKMRVFPFIAIYDKKHTLLKTFEGSAKMDDLLEYVK